MNERYLTTKFFYLLILKYCQLYNFYFYTVSRDAVASRYKVTIHRFSLSGHTHLNTHFYCCNFRKRNYSTVCSKILFRNSKNWLFSLCPPKEKKSLKSDQNCSVQVNFSISVFCDTPRSENFVTLNAFIRKLHFENGSQDFSGTT